MSAQQQHRGGRWLTAERLGAPRWLWMILSTALVAMLALVVVGTTQANAGRAGAGGAGDPADPVLHERVVALFFGDSYSAGTGASVQNRRFTTLVSKQLGWFEVNRALGGTGYVTTSDTRGCGAIYCPNYREALQNATSVHPDVVVVSGGRNDTWNEHTKAAIPEFFAALAEQYPDAKIVATSPLWVAEETPGSAKDFRSAVVAAVTAVGGTYLDLGEPLRSKQGGVSADGVHPNDAGYRAIADAFVAAWKKSGVSLTVP